MWNPGFHYEQSSKAELRGFTRSLCVSSIHHRGTQKKPGLVLGLDTGGKCTGIAYEVSSSRALETIKYLRSREQVTMVYREITRPITLIDQENRTVRSLVYAVNRDHVQYSGRLPFETQFNMVANGIGKSGNNIDYVVSTADHLKQIGIIDPAMERLAQRLRRRKCTKKA